MAFGKIIAIGAQVATGTVTAPSALTNNVIPKGTGAATLANSSITDNGANVSFAEPIVFPAGLGAISQIQGPSDQPFQIASGASQDIRIMPVTAGKSARIVGPSGATQLIVGDNIVQIVTSNVTLGNKISTYNSIATIDNGIPSELGHLDLTAQSAAITATTVYTPTATGRYRISIYEKVTTVDGVSSVLGGATGTVVTFTDGTDSVAQSITMALDNQAGTVQLFNNGNTTTTSLNGSCFIYAKTGVAIQIAVGYTSATPGQMIFAVRATCEAM